MSLDVCLTIEVDTGGETPIELPIFDRNITHNLGTMAGAANLYEVLWRPDELGFTHAGQLIETMEAGLQILEFDPRQFDEFVPSNGWGDYQGLVDFTRAYLEACKAHPKCRVEVSR